MSLFASVFPGYIKALLLAAVVFIPFERLAGAQPAQRIVRRGSATDVLTGFMNGLLLYGVLLAPIMGLDSLAAISARRISGSGSRPARSGLKPCSQSQSGTSASTASTGWRTPCRGCGVFMPFIIPPRRWIGWSRHAITRSTCCFVSRRIGQPAGDASRGDSLPAAPSAPSSSSWDGSHGSPTPMCGSTTVRYDTCLSLPTFTTGTTARRA